MLFVYNKANFFLPLFFACGSFPPLGISSTQISSECRNWKHVYVQAGLGSMNIGCNTKADHNEDLR